MNEDDSNLSAADRVHYNAVDQLFSLARHNRYKDVPIKLEEYGFDVDVENYHGNTLLCVASQNGLKRMAKLALRMGADIDHSNGMGNRPLHFCCAFGFAELAAYLISKGADPMLRNNNGVLCTEGLGKDALNVVNQAITDAQEAGLLDDTIPQHVEVPKEEPVLQEQEQWDYNNGEQQQEQQQEEQEPYYQEQEQPYYQEEEQTTTVIHTPPINDVFGVGSWNEKSERATTRIKTKPTIPSLSKSMSKASLLSSSSSSTSNERWRPLPKAPRPRPLPKAPRPLPNGAKPTINITTKPLGLPERQTTIIEKTKTTPKTKTPKTKTSTTKSTLPALKKTPSTTTTTKKSPLEPILPILPTLPTPRTRHGYTSILQAVHASDLTAVRGLTGYTTQQDVDASLHACGLCGSNQMLEILMPHATSKSLDRAMIAATARSHHHVVEYMLSQRGAIEEDDTQKDKNTTNSKSNGEAGKISQSGIDRALVRAAAVVPKTEQEWENMTDAEKERRRPTNGQHSNVNRRQSDGHAIVANTDNKNSDSSFLALLNMSTTPAIDRAFCAVASSGSGANKAALLLPWVSVRGRRSGLLTAATTGNWCVLQLVLGSMLEAEIDNVSNEKGDNVRARLRQEARFSTLARGMEGASSRGHGQCCELLWECCDDKAKERSIAAANLNGHVDLVDTMKRWRTEEQQYNEHVTQ